MAILYICRECKKYYSEEDFIKLKLIKLEPRTRVCQKCGAEMTYQKCFYQESFH